MRNEILEIGQTVLLYYNGTWMGKSQGLGTLTECYGVNSFEERWTVVLEDGEETSWAMRRTDKEWMTEECHPIVDDEIPF